MKKHIPNALTLANALSGCIGIFWVEKNLVIAAYFIFIGLFFDFFDGFVARLLHVKSEIGKQLDSLADAVTFGVLPAFIAQKLWLSHNNNEFLVYFPFLLALFSVLRLAKFNIDTRQTDSFIGVPTPANALIWASFPLILAYQPSDLAKSIIGNAWFLGVSILLMSYLLVAELPLFALKFKDFSWKNNQIKYIFLILSLILIIFLQFWAIPLIIFLYIGLSFIKKLKI
ncbi:MAG: CDP-diacylglycerol--serine O-phosphatidyltransferase [Thermonemataceae bacterium]|nr:CDP-diacylglycerol--serine O-phosphatidyltransferase [Thermonemataceae bacterium]